MSVNRTNFFFLTLDLPPTPLYKDAQNQNIIPQVSLYSLLKKFDGRTYTEEPVTCIKRKYKIHKLPKYLIFHVKRFVKNNFYIEKNTTIINFPVKNLDLKAYIDAPEENVSYKYDLIANIIHDGTHNSGTYRVQAKHKASDSWHDMQDLHVNQVMAQQVAISESYIQIYERQSE